MSLTSDQVEKQQIYKKRSQKKLLQLICQSAVSNESIMVMRTEKLRVESTADVFNILNELVAILHGYISSLSATKLLDNISRPYVSGRNIELFSRDVK